MIKPWQQRCEEHPDHDGIVSDGMIQARMQEEIDELRAALEPRQWQGLTEQEALNAAVYVFCQLADSLEEQKQIARDLGKACNEPHSALMRFAATIEELLEEKNR